MKYLILFGFIVMLISCKGKDEKVSVKKLEEKMAVQDSSLQQIIDNMKMQMYPPVYSGNNDRDFANLMIEHHKGAMRMAKFELNKGNDAALKKFADVLIKDQEGELKLMVSFLENEPQDKSSTSQEFQGLLNDSMKGMKHHSPSENNVDHLFPVMMIEHHESAAKMAQAESMYGSHQTLKILARNIMSKQSDEIQWLQSWLQKH